MAGSHVILLRRPLDSSDPAKMIIGHGDLWWVNDNQVNRPKFFGLYASNMIIRDMKILKPIAWTFGISGNGVVMTNTLIDARSDVGFPFNTGMTPLSLETKPS